MSRGDRDVRKLRAVNEQPEGRGSVVIVGAGPGIGLAVARRFGAEGHVVGLVALNRERTSG